jgi:hypothetical protein
MSGLAIHSEKYFRRYERFIATVVENYPKETHFKPRESVNTFVSRFRDALNGMRINGWQSELFTFEQCAGIFRLLRQGGDFIITVNGENVYVGPPIKDGGAIQVEASSAMSLEPGQVDARDKEVFCAIHLLKRRGYLPEPVEFVNVSNGQKTELEIAEGFIEFFESGDGVYVMI